MKKIKVIIEYCVECLYLKPALDAAQKILDAHAEQIESLALKPGQNGVFRVYADSAMVIQMGDEGLPNAAIVAEAFENYVARRPL